MENIFECSVCKRTITNTDPVSTGYALDEKKNKICFECCGTIDKNTLEFLERGQTMLLYWKPETEEITNWPGTLAIHSDHYTITKHSVPPSRNGNSAERFTIPRTNIWFTFRGNKYYGTQLGYDNQVCRVKKLFGRKPKEPKPVLINTKKSIL